MMLKRFLTESFLKVLILCTNCYFFSFFKDNAAKEIDIKEFEKASGIGIEISDSEIKTTIEKVIAENKEGICAQRYDSS